MFQCTFYYKISTQYFLSHRRAQPDRLAASGESPPTGHHRAGVPPQVAGDTKFPSREKQQTEEHPEADDGRFSRPATAPSADHRGRTGRSAGQGVRRPQRPRQPQAEKQRQAAPLHCDVTDEPPEGEARAAGDEARPPRERVLLVAGKARQRFELGVVQLQQQVAHQHEGGQREGEDAAAEGAAAGADVGEAGVGARQLA